MSRTSVALTTGRADNPMLVRRIDDRQGQAERLIPLIGDVMAAAAIPFQSLNRIAICVGPGGFSGIRTGVAAARAIGLAAQVPVTGATSFRIIASAFERRDEPPKTYGIVAPAGLKAVFCQVVARGVSPLTEIVVLPQSEIAEFFAGRADAIVGPAASSLAEEGHLSLPVKAVGLVPDAEMLAVIAPELDPARDLPSPHYVQPADARRQPPPIARKDY